MENNQKSPLSKVNLYRIMNTAFKFRIPIPAFNIAYLDMVEPVLTALKEMGCFGLVEVSRIDINRFKAISLTEVQKEYMKNADRSYSRLHADHIPIIDENEKLVDWRKWIKKSIDLNYDSLMIDGSRLSIDDNIKTTKEVVKMSHKKQIPVEAELGAVFGHENEVFLAYEELFRSGKGFTNPLEAKRFVNETGIDWLSVAIGNIHGAISGFEFNKKKINARLNIEHLKKIVQVVKIPIVLHGGSGIKKESILSGFKNGVTKINIGTVIRQKFELGKKEKGILEGQNKVKEEIKYLISKYFQIQGSARKLASLIDESY
jgi:ketose-bisphosphate aldolase